MAKKTTTVKVTCMSANKNQNGAMLTFAAGVNKGEKGMTARTVVNVSVPEQDRANEFEVGKEYTVTIEG